jgi:hypothetical protein
MLSLKLKAAVRSIGMLRTAMGPDPAIADVMPD